MFPLNKNIRHSVLGWFPVFSRLISICLWATPFNITVVQAYVQTTDNSDDKLEEFYTQHQSIINSINKRDVLIVQGDWNAKVGVEALKDWKNFYKTSGNAVTNEWELCLLEFVSDNDMILANTLGTHKASWCWTWHVPNRANLSQMDYILVQNWFWSGINRAKTRTFPGADVGSDYNMVILNFKVRLKKIRKPKNTRLRLNLDRLEDPSISKACQTTDGRKFTTSLWLDDDAEAMTKSFNAVMIDAANDLIGKCCEKSQFWVTDEILKTVWQMKTPEEG